MRFAALLFTVLILWTQYQHTHPAAALPVQHEGRVKPLDTVARSSLLLLQGKQTVASTSSTPSMTPIEWLLLLLCDVEKANTVPVFRIDHPGVVGLMGLPSGTTHTFSMEQIEPHLEDIRQQTEQAMELRDEERDDHQQAMVDIWQKISLYTQLSHSLYIAFAEDPQNEVTLYNRGLKEIIPMFKAGTIDQLSDEDVELLQWFIERYQWIASSALFQVLPPLKDDPESEWLNIGQALLKRLEDPRLYPQVDTLVSMINAYREGNDEAVAALLSPLQNESTSLEHTFNRLQPFYVCTLLYTSAFIIGLFSWVRWSLPLQRLSFWMVVCAAVIHTSALVIRMIIEGRPPVTNIYSSAIFVGWAAALLSVVVELLSGKGFGTIVASIVGALTLIIAHHLSTSGDTIEMMRAVLNSNFWLSTHVVVITLGYSGCFLAGTLAALATLKEWFSPGTLKETAPTLYGLICFCMLFSFVGTVLGGVWADQSWGRFWGWDPKENGALLIVLWNAVILHARWGGMIGVKGLAMMAIGGNIITSFSWFGVNMIGVGLHSYGFMEGAFFWLIAFMVSQLILIGAAAALPKPDHR